MIRKSIKKILKHFFKRTAKSTEERINVRNRGSINLIDIGSAGILPKPWVSRPEVIRHLLKFEPREDSVQTKNIVTISAALWNNNELRPFYVYKGFNQTGSSLFKQNYEYVRHNFELLKNQGLTNLAETWFDRSELVREENLHCQRLIDVIHEYKLSTDYHFIKIDAQGAEYQILQGAEEILRSTCLGLHLELFKIPLYKDIALLPEVTDYLKTFGFDLVKRFPAHGSFDSQHDCLFLKTGSKEKDKLELIRKLYNLN